MTQGAHLQNGRLEAPDKRASLVRCRIKEGLALALFGFAAPSIANAQDWTCQSTQYCEAGATACQPSSIPLMIKQSGAEVTLAWEGRQAFQGQVVRTEAPVVIASLATDTSPFMLVVGESGQASFSTATDFGDYLIAGIYTLTCGLPS
jgi:hypothetical protein